MIWRRIRLLVTSRLCFFNDGRGELQIPIRLIFHNDDVVLAADGVELFSAFD